ncbi:unnamed protein product [Malus baccata var. baccata]
MKRLQVAPPASASDEIENGDAKAIYRDDRFSALPDEVVHRILPLLPFSDVIRVGSLSKRCGQVCSPIPTLNFSEFPSDSTANFVNRLELLASLDNFFVNRNGKVQLQTFDLVWEFPLYQFEEYEARRVCASISNAVECRLENLPVFCGSLSAKVGWTLREPVEFLSGDLAMLGTIIKARSFSTCTISNLVRLRLKNVMMEDGERFCKWVSSACRFIKELVLENVARLQNITIESSPLESVQLRSTLGNLSMYLRYLSLYWRGYTTINLRNPGEFNNLEKAELDMDMDSSTTHDQLVLSRVLQSVNYWDLLRIWQQRSPNIGALLKRLPSLNILEIYVSYVFGTPERGSDRRYWQLQNLDFISQLKEVTLEGFEASNDSNLYEFARNVLEHDQNLKKMVVICEPSESRLIR